MSMFPAYTDADILSQDGISENHPIWKAIDSGGGQTCDVAGVIRELHKAGFVILRREMDQHLLACFCGWVGVRAELVSHEASMCCPDCKAIFASYPK